MELRCDGKLHGVVVKDGLLEIKCRSNRCGAKPGVVVLHIFNPSTGDLVETKKFQDPKVLFSKEEQPTWP